MTEAEIVDYIEKLFSEGFSEKEIRHFIDNDESLKEAVSSLSSAKSSGTRKPVMKAGGNNSDSMKKKPVMKAGVQNEDATDPNPPEFSDTGSSAFTHWYHETVIGGKWQFPSVEDAYASYGNWCKMGQKSEISKEEFHQQLADFNAGLINAMEKPKLESVYTEMFERQMKTRSFSRKETKEEIRESVKITGLTPLQQAILDSKTLNKKK